MAEFKEFNQFGSAKPAGSQCAHVEAMLADALDHTLSADDQAIFDLHLASCANCSRMYKDARRGADWLVMLKTPQLEPSSALLDRIFAVTSNASHTADLPAANVQPNTLLGSPALVPASIAAAPAASGNVIPFRQRVVNAFRIQALRHNFMQPRLAMTAAMAFFSVALTLNLTGVHITQLKANDLKPSSIRRSFYDANARFARSIDNLRVVYELESRVQDLQRHDDSTTAPAQNNTPAPDSNQNSPSGDQKNDDQKAPGQQKQPSPRPRSGSSRSDAPRPALQYTASAEQQGASPQPSAPHKQLSLLSTPNVFKYDQQGGQA